MIISGGARTKWRTFAKHLMKTEENERVTIPEIRGLAADTVQEAFREMEALASGCRGKRFYYHVNVNWRADEELTPEQKMYAIDTLEKNLGLEGHSRFVVEHEKKGRTHDHIVWSAVRPGTNTLVSDSWNYIVHQQTARELEKEFGHEPVKSVHGREQGTERAERRPKNYETFRAHKNRVDLDAFKNELTELWHQADSGKAFAAAVEERGYVLAQGDRRDFCVMDHAGDEHSLARYIRGARKATVEERMQDVDRDALPTVAEASAEIKAGDSSDAPRRKPEVQDIQRQPVGQAASVPELATPAAPEKPEPAAKQELAKELAGAVWDALKEEAEEHEGLPPGTGLVERTALILARDEITEHGKDWLGTLRAFLRDESSGAGFAHKNLDAVEALYETAKSETHRTHSWTPEEIDAARTATGGPRDLSMQEQIDAFTAPYKQQIHTHGSVIHRDGLTWWQRTAETFTHARESAKQWISEQSKTFVDYVTNRDRLKPPEQDGPDWDR